MLGAGSSATDTNFAAVLEGKDPKTQVNQFCQRYCRRPVTREDIVYTVTKYPSGFQATVKLNCIEGQEFAGDLAPNQKEAEMTASQQILDFYAEQIACMPSGGVKKKRKVTGTTGVQDPSKMLKIGEDGGARVPTPNYSAISSKSELNTAVSKILRRVMQKGDVQYETHQVVGGYQATVRMPDLPGEWSQQIWAGEVHQKKPDAEQSAAFIALEAIQADPELMAAYNAPQKPKNWSGFGQGGKGKSKGYMQKGGGKGYGISPSQALAWNSSAQAANFWGGFPGAAMQTWGM